MSLVGRNRLRLTRIEPRTPMKRISSRPGFFLWLLLSAWLLDGLLALGTAQAAEANRREPAALRYDRFVRGRRQHLYVVESSLLPEVDDGLLGSL